MSGMGGRLTIDILKRAFKRLGKSFELVLQPQSEIFLVRAFLRDEGIKIVDETMVFDQGKYYSVIKAQPESGREGPAAGNKEDREGRQNYPQIVEDHFGPVLLNKRPGVFLDFLKKEKEKTDSLLSRVTKEKRRKELQEYLLYVETAMNTRVKGNKSCMKGNKSCMEGNG